MTDAPQPRVTVIDDPRDAILRAAGLELENWARDWALRHGLTAAEYRYVIGILLFRANHDAIRVERGLV